MYSAKISFLPDARLKNRGFFFFLFNLKREINPCMAIYLCSDLINRVQENRVGVVGQALSWRVKCGSKDMTRYYDV